MPLTDDQSIPVDAVLFRVLRNDPNWTKIKEGTLRPTSLAFFSNEQEVSYFLDSAGMLAELQRLFPGHRIVRIPAAVMRGQGFAIERRPDPGDCPPDFQRDRACHVVAGPNAEVTRIEYQRRARSIANHADVNIIEPETQRPGTDQV